MPVLIQSRSAVLACALMIGASVAFAQEPTSGLQLRLETERPSYELGEPIYLIVRVVNAGNRAETLVPVLNPKDGMLAVSVRAPDGQGKGFVALSARDREADPIVLAPKGQVATTFPIFFGATGWLFETPGRYVVRAEFAVNSAPGKWQTIRADPITVTVTDKGMEAGRFLMQKDAAGTQAGKFLVWGSGDQLVQGMERLNQLAERFPGAPVVDYYRVALGRSLARPFKNYATNKVRPADYPGALSSLERSRDSALVSPVLVQKYIAQAMSLLGTGRSAEASAAIKRAGALIESRPELADFRQQLERVERAAEGRK